MDGYGLQNEELVKIQKGLQSIEDVAAKERIRAAALQAQSTQLALSRMDYERKLKDQLSVERVKRKELREKLNSCSDSLQVAVCKTSNLSSALDYALKQQHVAFDTLTAKDAELCALMDKNRLLEREMYQTQRNLDIGKLLTDTPLRETSNSKGITLDEMIRMLHPLLNFTVFAVFTTSLQPKTK
jgi:predicted RNase H-like nuclease (RuvC/YqgF family)